MNITLEKTSPVSAVITLNFEKSDYEVDLTKAIKSFCTKAQMPGFRKGKVPFGMAKKLYGPQAKMETINKLLSDNLFKYIEEQKISILGEPLPNEAQETQDIENQDNFKFQFDVALSPEFDVEVSKNDKITYYNISVSDKQVDEQVQALAQQAGQPESVQSYKDGDILRGILVELDAEGNVKEEGLNVEKSSLMPKFMKEDKQKDLFKKSKVNDVIIFNPAAAYGEAELASLLHLTKEEAAKYTGDFSFQVEEISRFVPAKLDQDFFDKVYGKDVVKSEEEFKAKVKEQLENRAKGDSDYKFFIDLRKYLEEKVGKIEFPDTLLKRIMLANNKDKDEKYVEEHFSESLNELKWHLIKEKLAAAHTIKVEDKDIKKMAVDASRFQFAQYGMNNIPEEYIEQYAQQMLKDKNQVNALVERSVDAKLTEIMKDIVTLNEHAITTEEFEKLFEEKK